MKTIANCLFIILMLLCQNTKAASTPLAHSFPYTLSDSGIRNTLVFTPFTLAPYKKAGWLRKLIHKRALKRSNYSAARINDDAPPRKNLLSTISLILGIIGAVSLFIPAIAGIALIAGPAALITGIIALGKRYNNSKASRTKAIIGLVLGGALVFLGILAVIVVATY